MNQELFTKATKWILYASMGVLAIAAFFVFFGPRGEYRTVKNKGMPALSPTDTSLSDGMAGRGLSFDEGAAVESAPAPMMEQKMMAEIAPSGVDGSVSDRKIVKNGSLSMVVESADWTADKIDEIATRFGGFTVSRSISDQAFQPMYSYRAMEQGDAPAMSKGVRSGTVVVKVPSGKFSEAVQEIKKMARVVTNDSSSADDVTAAFVDLEARLKNKYAEEEAFTKILNTNAQKVSDILEVTRELSRVRGEIEQLEAEKKLMVSQTDMAEISVFLSEDAQVGEVSDDWRPWQIAKNAVNRLIAHFQGFVEGAIYFVISVLPLFVLYLFGLYLAFLVGRKVYRKIAKTE